MRLELIPDENGYSVIYSNTSTIQNELLGGPASKRLDFNDITYLADVEFTLNAERYDYLCEFLDIYEASPQWFDCLLVIEPYIADYPLRNYKAQITPGSVTLREAGNGSRFVVGLQLECYLDDLPLTSKNYPVDESDSMKVSAFFAEGAMKITNHVYDRYSSSTPLGDSINGLDYVKVNPFFVEGDLRGLLQTYDKWPAESATVAAFFSEGEIRTILRLYDKWPVESATVQASFVEGEIKTTLIIYDKWPVESIGITANFVEGTLT